MRQVGLGHLGYRSGIERWWSRVGEQRRSDRILDILNQAPIPRWCCRRAPTSIATSLDLAVVDPSPLLSRARQIV